MNHFTTNERITELEKLSDYRGKQITELKKQLDKVQGDLEALDGAFAFHSTRNAGGCHSGGAGGAGTVHYQAVVTANKSLASDRLEEQFKEVVDYKNPYVLAVFKKDRAMEFVAFFRQIGTDALEDNKFEYRLGEFYDSKRFADRNEAVEAGNNLVDGYEDTDIVHFSVIDTHNRGASKKYLPKYENDTSKGGE